jgi:chemotaxis protein MotA
MHVIIGACIIAGSFLLSLEYMTASFDGYWNAYSMILLAGVPIGVAICSHRLSTFRTAVRVLAAALTRQLDRERSDTLRDLVELGRAVRAGRGRDAYQRIEASPDPIFRTLGQHVLQRSDPEEIEADALLLGRRELDEVHVVERLFSTMGSAAPAVGMTGTVIGLIQLLIHLDDLSALGSGMAIALLTTLYGLLLGHLVYMPVARLIGELGRDRAQTMGLVTDGMLKLARQRPLHELEQVLDGGNRQRAAAERLTGAKA